MPIQVRGWYLRTSVNKWPFDKYDHERLVEFLKKGMPQDEEGRRGYIHHLRQYRVNVMADTVEACIRQWYPGMAPIGPDQSSEFQACFERSKNDRSISKSLTEVRTELTTLGLTPPKRNKPAPVIVVNADTLVAARVMAWEDKYKVCVLNMANAYAIGGGFCSGAAAQEESLFRRTNLYARLGRKEEVEHIERDIRGGIAPQFQGVIPRSATHALHPIPSTSTVYTKNVIVFRDEESKGYRYLLKPYLVDVVSAAAIDRGRNGTNAPLDQPMSEEELRITEHTIVSTIMRAAVEGAECLVLGALGCGAFANPPEAVSRLFYKALKEKQLAQLFKIVVFAVIDDGNSSKNLSVFTSTLNDRPDAAYSFDELWGWANESVNN